MIFQSINHKSKNFRAYLGGKRRSVPLTIFLLLLGLISDSFCYKTDDYKTILEKWKRTQKKLTYEISLQAQGKKISIKEESLLTPALSDDYVEMTITFQTPELLQTYIEMEKENKELGNTEVQKLKKSLSFEYDLKNSLCFTVEIKNNSKCFTYLYLKPIADKFSLRDNLGREFKPIRWDKELNQAMSREVRGKIFFPRQDKKGIPIITARTKWLKLIVYRIFPLSYLPLYGQQPDFEFIFPLNEDALSSHFFINEEKTSDLQELINNGVEAYKKGNIEEAISLWESALKIDQESIIVYNLLGTAYLEENLFDAAIQILKVAIEIDPLSSLSHYNLGLAYYQKKEWEKAEVEFVQAIAINYYYVSAHYYLGLAYEQQRKWKKAEEEYKIVLELHKGHSLAQEGLLRIKKVGD